MLWQANCTTLFQVSLDCLISFFCGLDFSFSTIGKLSNLCFLQSQLFGAILLWMPSLEQFCQKPCGFGKCSLFHWLFYLMPCQVLCHITKAIYFHIIFLCFMSSHIESHNTKLHHVTQSQVMSCLVLFEDVMTGHSIDCLMSCQVQTPHMSPKSYTMVLFSHVSLHLMLSCVT